VDRGLTGLRASIAPPVAFCSQLESVGTSVSNRPSSDAASILGRRGGLEIMVSTRLSCTMYRMEPCCERAMPNSPPLSSDSANASTCPVGKAVNAARPLWLLWISMVVLFVAIWMYPLGDGRTRLAGIIVLLAIWFGFIGLTWNYRILRIATLALTAFCGVFLVFPGRSHHDAALLLGFRRRYAPLYQCQILLGWRESQGY
jgi:hypothetical protein